METEGDRCLCIAISFRVVSETTAMVIGRGDGAAPTSYNGGGSSVSQTSWPGTTHVWCSCRERERWGYRREGVTGSGDRRVHTAGQRPGMASTLREGHIDSLEVRTADHLSPVIYLSIRRRPPVRRRMRMTTSAACVWLRFFASCFFIVLDGARIRGRRGVKYAVKDEKEVVASAQRRGTS